MIRLLALFALVVGLLIGANAFADSVSGCLATDLSAPITWTLPSTPGTPSWTLNSHGYSIGGIPPMPVAVPFSATFWRRPECPSQLILTLNMSAPVYLMGLFSVFQGGHSDAIFGMIVNDPAVYGLNLLPLFVGSQPPVGAISGVVKFDIGNLANIDPSQAMTIDYTPLSVSGPESVIQVQIPAAASSTSSFAIGNGITGNWYDPSESGHGFGIEVLPGNTMLAEWYVYAPNGGQAWIVATGPITGNTAVLQAFQKVGSGGVFPPNFNPTQLQNLPWGTITFTFTDCNNGTVSWQPTVAGYTSGSIPIQRLTMPAGLTCP